MNRILKLDAELTSLFSDFKSVASELNPEYICSLADEAKILEQKYAGIYLIEIHTGENSTDVVEWISELRLQWEHPDFLKKFTANFRKKRIRHHKSLSEWMPLYIGKSKNVGKRVLEHLNLGLDKSTFAMKIKARPTMAQRELRLSTLRLQQVGNYNIIAPALESALRDRINPLVGKQ